MECGFWIKSVNFLGVFVNFLRNLSVFAKKFTLFLNLWIASLRSQ